MMAVSVIVLSTAPEFVLACAGGVAPQEVQQAAAPAVPCPPHPGAGQAPKAGGGHAMNP